MKKILLYAMMLVAGLSLGSCVKSSLDPLSGDYLPAPTVVKLDKLDKSEAYKDEAGRWTFVLDLSSASATKLHAVIIGNKYYLGSNTYSAANDATAKNGNFIAEKTSVNGTAVKSGDITVRQDGSDYSLSAVLFLTDGTPYKMEWEGQIVYEEPVVLDPEYTYSDAIAMDCTLEDGQTLVEDVESHTLTLKDKSGEFAAQIKLIRSKGTATSGLAGKYTVAEYAHEDFSAGNGFDLGVYFGMAAGAYVIGSYYVADGTVVIIEPGETIDVTDMGDGVYSISGSTGYSFLCAPEGFVPGGGEVYDMTETVAQDCTLEDGQTLVEDVESHTFVLTKGEEFIAQMKLIRSVGTTDMAGEYTVKEYAHEDFSAGNGFDLGAMFGMDPGAWVIGSYFMQDGAIVIVQPGETISVTSAGENTWKFTGADWEFTGKLASVDPGPGPGPGPEDNFDYTPGAAYNASSNLWKPVDAAHAVNYFMYMNIAQDWSVTKYDNVGGAECPYAEFKESTYKLSFEDQTFDRWQNQFYIYPQEGHFIPLSADKTYKFSVTLQSTESFGAFFKLVQYNPDATNPPKYEGAAIWEPEGYPNNVVFEAGKPVVLEKEITGVDCSNINLIFDFGGNPAGTVVYVKDITLSEVGGEPGPGEEPVQLSEFLSLTDYSMYNMPMVGVELGTPGFYYQPADWVSTWTPTYPVDGNFLKLEVYSEDGKVAPGTYVPSAANGTVNPGEFNLGAESWGGAGGTTWYTVAGGAATFDLVTDGTVTISKDGDVYTIEIATSAVTAKYVGKLSAGGENPGGETAITIDGDLSDWAGIAAGLSSEEGPYLEFKATNDDEFIYLYSKRTWHDGLWKDSSGGYYYFEFDTDNDSSTGTMDVNGNTGFGVEAWMYLYLFTGTKDAPTFASAPAGAGYPSSSVIENVIAAGHTDMEVIETEVRIPMANIGVAKGQTIKVYTWGNKSAGNLKGEDSFLQMTIQ